MTGQLVMCTSHPALVAAWRCGGCAKALCQDCAAADFVGKAAVARCLHCRTMAVPLRYTPEILPVLEAAKHYGRALLEFDAILQLAALAFVIGLTSLMPILGLKLIAPIFVAAYYLQVLAHTAYGRPGLPSWGGENSEKTLKGLWRLISATWYVWFPIALYLTWRDLLLDTIFLTVTPVGDPVVILLFLYAAAVLPAAVMAAAFSSEMRVTVDPRTALGFVYANRPDYLLMCGIWAATVVADRLFAIPFGWLYDTVTIPIIVPGISAFFELFIPIMSAHLLGHFVWQNGIALEIFTPEDRIRDQVHEAKPRGELPEKPHHDDEALPIDLELVGHEATYDPLPPPVDPTSFEVPSDEPAIDLELAIDLADPNDWTLAGALDLGDDAAARSRFKEIERLGSASTLPAADLVRLAEALERLGDQTEAASVWRAAAEVDLTGPHAPEAVYGLARLMDVLGQKEQSLALLQSLLTRFPDHPRALEVRQRLAPTAGDG